MVDAFLFCAADATMAASTGEEQVNLCEVCVGRIYWGGGGGGGSFFFKKKPPPPGGGRI